MSILVWQGPSMLTGDPIGLFAAPHSKNDKTGPMVQTYILRTDMNPQVAVWEGKDAAICGDCAFRGDGSKTRLCYVAIRRGPSAVFRNFSAGLHTLDSPKEVGRRRLVRLGAYGDPAAAPFEVWEEFLSRSLGHTGYTHAWRTCDPRFRRIVHASCDNPTDYYEAKAAGWMTYRVRLPEEPRMKGERPCPASGEAGKHVTCADCLGCDGQRRDFSIVAHGSNIPPKYRQFRLEAA